MKDKIIQVLRTALFFVLIMPVIDYVFAEFFGWGSSVFEGNSNKIIKWFAGNIITGIVIGIVNLKRTPKTEKQ